MIYGFFGIIILFVFVFQMKSAQNKYGGGGDWDGSPHYPEHWLVFLMYPTVLTQKRRFCNFHAVFGHFAQTVPLYQLNLFWKS